jgi:small subunit ribosomal protein S18
MSDVVQQKIEENSESKVNRPIDYKDIRSLSRFVSERGKIIPCRVNSQSVKRQREISKAIKRARILALMPFVSN